MLGRTWAGIILLEQYIVFLLARYLRKGLDNAVDTYSTGNMWEYSTQ